MFGTLIQVLNLLANILRIAVISQFVLYLLITYNVVSLHNRFVGALWTTANSILDPLLRPIRRRMPDTGMIDLSPMVLLFGIWLAQAILDILQKQYVGY